MEWSGVEWSVGVDWSGVECSLVWWSGVFSVELRRILFSFFLLLVVLHSLSFFLIFFLLAFQQHHKWYKETFKDYPRKRFALIPFTL